MLINELIELLKAILAQIPLQNVIFKYLRTLISNLKLLINLKLLL